MHSDPDPEIQNLYGVKYWPHGQTAAFRAPHNQLYDFTAYIGAHTVQVDKGDCAYWVSDDQSTALVQRGPTSIESVHLATVIRGYMPGDRQASLEVGTNLPYVNGCSTRQIFAPERLGDPTLQLLHIPPFSAEQAHHIHSTVRVVLVLSGKGQSVVGMEKRTVTQELLPGMVCILNPMCPHHFETPQGEPLVVLPLHIFSSVGPAEQAHPMFHGTHMMQQGQ